MPATVDVWFSRFAAELPDEELARQVKLAQRAVLVSARTRKAIAQHRLYCLECELKRRAEERDARNPGRA